MSEGMLGTTSVFTGFIGIWNLTSGSSHASALFRKSLMNSQFQMNPTKAGQWNSLRGPPVHGRQAPRWQAVPAFERAGRL
jgi:hypothetical protein